MLQPRLESDIGNAQHSQNQERANAHCPRKPNLGDQIRYHDGEDHSSQTGSGGCDAQCEGTTFGEPGADGVYAGVEYGACSEWTADSLGEDELVVLR